MGARPLAPDDARPRMPSSGSPSLWVEFELHPSADSPCPVADVHSGERGGTIQLVGEECHLTLDRNGDEDDVSAFTTDIDDRCVCPAFCGNGCTPELLSVEGGAIIIGAYLQDREVLSGILEEVEDRATGISLRRLSAPNRGEECPSVETGIGSEISLTQKQREAVRTAVEMGYYRRPREASLGDLSEQLGITRSALSQRLNAVESKLVRSLAGELRG
ncbi:MAG: helix-turn-helix domain-containing protein [Halodesulfurarchaeum sp.]